MALSAFWLLAPKFRTMMAGLVVLSLLGAGAWIYYRSGTIDRLRLDVVEYSVYVEDLEDALTAQNSMIEGLTNKKIMFKAKRDEATIAIKRIEGLKQSLIQEIVRQKIGASCEENMDFLLEQAKKNSW